MDVWKTIAKFIFQREGRTEPVRFRSELETSLFQFGARAKVMATAETEAAGIAGWIGTVFGQTTPSLSKVSVLGVPHNDFAINLNFGKPSESYWFAEHLLELVEAPPEMRVDIDPKKGDGGFIEVREIPPSNRH